MCRYAAQNAHVVVIQVDFRLGPEHPTPAQVEDCTAAYKWVSRTLLAISSFVSVRTLIHMEADRTTVPP